MQYIDEYFLKLVTILCERLKRNQKLNKIGENFETVLNVCSFFTKSYNPQRYFEF